MPAPSRGAAQAGTSRPCINTWTGLRPAPHAACRGAGLQACEARLKPCPTGVDTTELQGGVPGVGLSVHAGRSAPVPVPPHSAAVTRRILRSLERHHPGAFTELTFRNAFELLAATILSAQCTDERVNQVTPALFDRYPTPGALALAEPEHLEALIRPTGFFRSKSRSLVGMARVVVERHGGVVPADLTALVALPGVGRKTANVVLGHALGVPGLPVDRHVLRVANRLGIARSNDPVVVEHQLGAALPKARWTLASDTLILHGRRICKPRPLCDRCDARGDCLHVEVTGPKAPPPARRARAAGAPVSSASQGRRSLGVKKR